MDSELRVAVLIFLGLLTGTPAISCGASGVSTVNQHPISLPVDTLIREGKSVVIKLPAAFLKAQAGKSIVLDVSAIPTFVDKDPFIVTACLNGNCKDTLNNLAFFPLPKVGEIRHFVVQIPSNFTTSVASGELDSDLILSIEPVRPGGKVGSSSVRIENIKPAN